MTSTAHNDYERELALIAPLREVVPNVNYNRVLEHNRSSSEF